MTDHRPRPALRLVEGRKPSVLDNPRALRDFRLVCGQTGILDPDTGLVRPRCGTSPRLQAERWAAGIATAFSADGSWLQS
jgi:hypothetical protein